ncbi:MAG: hypothetical protein COA58_10345 [Bacteroidetes bacterium]|nr:MAG: hypothetical protein COA58_10345 [Bacteroidota bacterium]
MNAWEKIKYEFKKGDSAIRQIIMINLAVFIFTILVSAVATVYAFEGKDLLKYFYLPSHGGTLLMRPWTIITNIFFHEGFSHIFWNMLILFFLGRILEDFMSSRNIWRIFLFGGIAGSLLFVISYNVFPIFSEAVSQATLLGASGGVTAIVVATGVFLPRYQIRPFGLFNIELRWIALFFVFRDLYSFPSGENLGGMFAHLGGALFGALFILNLQGKINLPSFNWDRLKPRRARKVVYYEKDSKKKKTEKKTKPNQQEIDAILDKISHSGYDSLSKAEKEILFKASEKGS